MKSSWSIWSALAVLASSLTVCSPSYAQMEGFPEKPARTDAAEWRDLQLAVSKSLGTAVKLTGDRSSLGADGESLDFFGVSVALDGDTALVGAYMDDIGTRMDQGSVYVFGRGAAGWGLKQKLTLVDGASIDQFGRAVALQGDTALIGAPNRAIDGALQSGAVYVFTRVGATWSQHQELVRPALSPGHNLGLSVALDGDTALVGAAGAAYVFVRNGSIWSTHQGLVSSSLGALGNAVALQGSTALVGAEHEAVGDNASQGSVYVFERSGGTWTERQKLLAPDGMAEDSFGNALALDGARLLVGAHKDDLQNNTIRDGGSVHVFVRTGNSWIHEQQLFGVDTALTQSEFGSSVALEGELAIVGEPRGYDGIRDQGKAFVFRQVAGTWTQQQIIRASRGAAGDLLGSSAALDGGTVFLGARGDGLGPNGARGSVTVFTQNGATFSQQQTLTAGVGGGGNRFGYAVDVNGDTAIVGAYGHAIGSNEEQGAAYVFVRSGPLWVLQQKLWAGDGNDYEDFGYSVALDGNTALVGAYHGRVEGTDFNTVWQGAAYVFQRVGQTWHTQQKLLASDRSGGDMFGVAVDIEGDTALVGAHEEWLPGGQRQGAAYVFVRNGATWAQQQKLAASDGLTDARFGNAVSLAGDAALIGASTHDNEGSAYVFARQQGGWIEQQKLIASDASIFARFGNSVALEGEYALVGAPGANSSQGAVYAFARAGTAWTQQRKLIAPDGNTGDNFGSSVALSGSRALVGSPVGYGIEPQRGSAYLFNRSGSNWDAGSKILAADGAREHFFGWAVALDGETALIGAPGHTSELPHASVDEGAAYVFAPPPPGGAPQLPASNILYDARRDGHGIEFVRVRDSLYVLTFYTYGIDGQPEWYQALGNVVNGVFAPVPDASGKTLFRYRYVPGNSPPQQQVPAQSGTVSVDFNAPATRAPCNDGRIATNAVAVMTFSLGADQNVRWCMEPIVAVSARATPDFSGLWFGGSADDGWGWSVLNFRLANQNGLAAILFYYDGAGNSSFAYAQTAPFVSGAPAPLFHRRGYCRTCPTVPFVDQPAGAATFTFTQPSESTSANNRVSYVATPQNSVGGTFARTNSPFALLTSPQ